MRTILYRKRIPGLLDSPIEKRTEISERACRRIHLTGMCWLLTIVGGVVFVALQLLNASPGLRIAAVLCGVACVFAFIQFMLRRLFSAMEQILAEVKEEGNRTSSPS